MQKVKYLKLFMLIKVYESKKKKRKKKANPSCFILKLK